MSAVLARSDRDPDAGAASEALVLPRLVDVGWGGQAGPGELARTVAVEGGEVVPVAAGVVALTDVLARRGQAAVLAELEAAVAAGPTAAAVRLLEQLDVGLLGAADRAAALRAAEACVAWLQAVSLRLTAAVADSHVAVEARAEDELARTAAKRGATAGQDAVLARQLAEESAATEVAGALRVSRRSAAVRVRAAVTLRDQLPRLAEQLAGGRTSLLHVLAAVAETRVVSGPKALRGLDALLAELAGRLPVGAFRSRVRALVLSAEPEVAARRHEHALSRRRVGYWPEDDGMATLAATLPAPQARAVWLALDAAARARRLADPGGTRCLDALRADAFVALTTGGSGDRGTTVASARVELGIVVDLPTLLGLQDNPGHLVGHGPIPADLARRLAGDAAWRRLVADPLSGALLDAAPRRYTPGRRLRRFLDLRDTGCTAPGCSVGTRDCDADHGLPFAVGGETVRANLSLASRRHHTLHTVGGWGVCRDEAAQATVWTTPFGTPYARPDPPVLPHLDRRGGRPDGVDPPDVPPF